MRPGELDQAYVLLSQTITRVPAEEQSVFLARLVLLLLASATDLETAMSAIRAAAHGGVSAVAR